MTTGSGGEAGLWLNPVLNKVVNMQWHPMTCSVVLVCTCTGLKTTTPAAVVKLV